MSDYFFNVSGFVISFLSLLFLIRNTFLLKEINFQYIRKQDYKKYINSYFLQNYNIIFSNKLIYNIFKRLLFLKTVKILTGEFLNIHFFQHYKKINIVPGVTIKNNIFDIKIIKNDLVSFSLPSSITHNRLFLIKSFFKYRRLYENYRNEN